MKIALFCNPQSFDAPPPGTLANIPNVYRTLFLETRIIDLHFPADSLCLSSFNFFWWAPQDFSISILAVQGHPRSIILVPNETAYATYY